MAMFRTTEENYFNNLPGSYSDNLLQEYFETKEKNFQEAMRFFSFNLDNNQKKYLVNLGISLSPVQTETHPHPVCKTIENWILYKCLPSVLPKEGNLIMMSIKENKAKYIFDRLKTRREDQYILNKIFEVKDVSRYSNQSVIHHGHQNFNSFLNAVERRLASSSNLNNFFFHDEMHHWTFENFASFLDKLKPQNVFFTCVYPAELLEGLTSSMNSIAYSYEVSGDSFFFFPDGKGSEPYIQKIENNWALKTSKIKIKRRSKPSGWMRASEEIGEVVYTLTKLNTYGAHHVFVCSRGDFSSEQSRFFNDYDLVKPDILVKMFKAEGRLKVATPRMRLWMLEKIVSYLVCLKKPDVESALAKLRQLSDFDLSLAEVTIVGMISRMIMSYGASDTITFFDYLKHPTTTVLNSVASGLPNLKYALSDTGFALRLATDELINGNNAFRVKIETEVRSHVICDSFMKNDSTVGPKPPVIVNRFNFGPPPGFANLLHVDENSKEIKTHKAEAKKDNNNNHNGINIGEPQSGESLNEEEKNDSGCCDCGFKAEVLQLEPVCLNLDSKPDVLRGREAWFFSRKGEGYEYNGGRHLSKGWSKELDHILSFFELDVNEFDHCLVQRYEPGASIGFHSDNEECYKPSCPVLTINAEGSCVFEVSCRKGSFAFRLDGPCAFLMPSGFQFSHKHKVKATSRRLSLTFRATGVYEIHSLSFRRETSTLHKTVGTASRQNDCFLAAVAIELNHDADSLINNVVSLLKNSTGSQDTLEKILSDQPLSLKDINNICELKGWRVHIHMGSEVKKINDDEELRVINLGGRPGHIFNLKKEVKEPEALSNLILRAQSSTYGKTYFKDDVRLTEGNRVSILIKAFKSMNFGALIDRSKVNSGKLLPRGLIDLSYGDDIFWNDILKRVKVSLVPFQGFAGSGKTNALLNILADAHNPGQFLFISSRKEVVDQIKTKLRERREKDKTSLESCFKTFESALLVDHIPELVIIDECSLMPPGYTSLLALKRITSEKRDLLSIKDLQGLSKVLNRLDDVSITIAFTGDILQSSFFSEGYSALNGVPNELVFLNSKLNKESIPYLLGTRRFGTPTTDFLELPFYGQGSSDVLLLKSLDSLNLDKYKEQIDNRKLTALVASHSDKRFLSSHYLHCLTFGESQGSTFDYVVLYMTPDILKVSNESLMVALTRHRRGLFIVLEENFMQDFNSPRAALKDVTKLLSKDFSFLNDFIQSKLACFDVVDTLPFGHDFELKLAGDPFLKSELTLLKHDDLLLTQIPDCDPSVNIEPLLKVHVPLAEQSLLTLEISEKMKAREHREFKGYGKGVSEQFKESFGLREKNKSSQAWASEAVFPRHRNSDSNTFWAACRKRLVFSNPRANIESLRRNRNVGKEMLKVFLKYVNLDKGIDVALWNQSVAEFEEKKISKNASTLANHHVRSLKDWKDNEIFLFIKNQLCTKSEKMFTEAKAGQTLACFSHSLLVKFAPLSRYIEHKVSSCLDERFYVHQKKNFDALNEWVKKQGFIQRCTESDYEAFDRSQDSMTLAFELELMKFLGIDQGLIEDYTWLKCHLDCKLGTLAIMRFTGEFGTFLFNTLTNMVFTFMRYDIKKDVSICFAGDDMCANQDLKIRHEYDWILNCMSLKAKVQVTDKPMFCGWLLSEHGIIKSPRLIEARLRVAEEKGVLETVMDSYFLEYSYAFMMGDNLCKVLDDLNLGYHYSLTRFFVKNKNKLRGESRRILESSKQGDDLAFGEVVFGSSSLGLAFNRLGRLVNKIDNKRCLLFQSPNFSENYQNQMTLCMSMPYTQITSIKTSVFWEGHPMAKLEGFKAASQFQPRGMKERLDAIFNASIPVRSSISGQNQINSVSYISEECSSRSLVFSKLESLWRVDSFTLMNVLSKGASLANQALLSTSAVDKLIFFTSQTTQYQLMIQTLTKRVGLFLNFQGLRCWKDPMRLMWMSVSFIGSQTKLTFSRCSHKFVRWLHKKSRERGNFWTWVRMILKGLAMSARILFFSLPKISKLVVNCLVGTARCFLLSFTGVCYLTLSVCREACQHGLSQDLMLKTLRLIGYPVLTPLIALPGALVEVIGSTLGQLGRELINSWRNLVEETKIKLKTNRMSALQIVSNQIKQGVEEQLWDMIDHGNALDLTPIPPAQLDATQRTRKRAILNHYLDYLVGNVAILGSSKETQYPTFDLRIPLMAGVEFPANFAPVIRLSDFMNRIEAWRDSQDDDWVKNSTRRQLMEPFAIHALHFLQMDPNNHVTNIARKRAYQCRRAPEVAFDFASGLPQSVITDARAQVISALNASLFRTEGQKGIFEARGFVEMNFDG